MNKLAIAIAVAALAGYAQVPGNPKQPFAAGSTKLPGRRRAPGVALGIPTLQAA